jgi:hypothetical protein
MFSYLLSGAAGEFTGTTSPGEHFLCIFCSWPVQKTTIRAGRLESCGYHFIMLKTIMWLVGGSASCNGNLESDHDSISDRPSGFNYQARLRLTMAGGIVLGSGHGR